MHGPNLTIFVTNELLGVVVAREAGRPAIERLGQVFVMDPPPRHRMPGARRPAVHSRCADAAKIRLARAAVALRLRGAQRTGAGGAV